MTDNKITNGFSGEERDAMKARAQELRAEARATKNLEEGEAALLSVVAEMPEPDRAVATKIHKIINNTAPMLIPKTWYGMPAYTNQEGKVICFFQAASKFKTRYSTLGFQDDAKLDNGSLWPVAFAIKELTPSEEIMIAELVKKAVS